MSRLSPALLVTLAWAALSAAAAGDQTILVRASRVYPVASEPIDDGQILIRSGRIVRVGKTVEAPEDARVIEVDGSVVPGFIDCGSTIAVRGSAAEEFYELTPEIRVEDALYLDDPSLERALHSGVTTVCVTPGDRNVLGGLGTVIRTTTGDVETALLKRDAFLAVSLTSATYSGNRTLRYSSPYSYYHRIPTTRMGTVFLARRALFEALDMKLPEGEPLAGSEGLARLLTDAGRKVVVESVRGRRPVRVRADDKQEILSAIRISDEFKAPIVIDGFIEGVELIPEIRRREIPVLIFPGAHVGTASSTVSRDRVHDLARSLEEAGVRFGFVSGSAAAVSLLRERVAVDLRFGLSGTAALRALTLDAARILGVDDHVGSIESGKQADLLAIDGDPFAITSSVDWVMVRGKIFSRDR